MSKASAVRDGVVELPDGRALGWAEHGDPAGRPRLYLHGTPGSRLQAAFLDDAATRAGVRLVAVERPGYGLSDPDEALSLLSFADDLVQALKALELPPVSVLAVSGGAGYALALARQRPDLVGALVLACGHVPHFGLPLPTEGRSLPDADLRLRDDPRVLGFREPDLAEAARQGSETWQRDVDVIYGRPGFDLAEVTVPVRVVHGALDVTVPVEAARWAAATLPNAELEVLDDAGHLFPYDVPDLLLTGPRG